MTVSRRWMFLPLVVGLALLVRLPDAAAQPDEAQAKATLSGPFHK